MSNRKSSDIVLYKMFDEQEAYFNYLEKLQQILNTYNAIIGTLSRRMFEIMDLFYVSLENAHFMRQKL